MPSRKIILNEEAYERLAGLKSSEKESFSDVILRYGPEKKKLSKVLEEIRPRPELADVIEKASRDLRRN